MESLETKKSSIQKIYERWKTIDFDEKKNEWDKQATEIADNKEITVQARKKLNEQTKNFRLMTEEEKIKNFNSLLKLYQEEVDRLTKRSKFSEVSFVSMYELVTEAPNPTIALVAALDISAQTAKVADLELENKKYKTEAEELKKELTEIKNQEVTLRRLEEKLKEYESDMERKVEEKTRKNEQKIKEENIKTINVLKEKELAVRKSLTQAREELTRTQKSLESTERELLQLKNKIDDKQSAKQSELEMLNDELERARSRILVLEREKELLSENNGNQPLSRKSSFIQSSPDLELKISQKEIELNQYKERVRELEFRLNDEILNRTSQTQELTQQLRQEQQRTNRLQQELIQRPTLDECNSLKEQITILKQALEYNVEDTEDLNIRTQEGLEKVLKDKNKKLETMVMQLKVALSQKENEFQSASDQLQKAEQTEANLKQLVSKLEEDIRKGVSIQSNPPTSQEVVNPSSSPSSDMLQIVCGQRDRFKILCEEAKTENRILSQRLDSAHSEISVLRSDNVKLFEKIRYLESYGSQTREVEGDEASLEGKYASLYEETVNPFTAFNRKEKYKRYKDLNPAEKMILTSGRFFLSSKYSRTFLFFYSVILHVLVFIVLYRMALADTKTCETN